jgi:hypothetical protein
LAFADPLRNQCAESAWRDHGRLGVQLGNFLDRTEDCADALDVLRGIVGHLICAQMIWYVSGGADEADEVAAEVGDVKPESEFCAAHSARRIATNRKNEMLRRLTVLALAVICPSRVDSRTQKGHFAGNSTENGAFRWWNWPDLLGCRIFTNRARKSVGVHPRRCANRYGRGYGFEGSVAGRWCRR